MTKPCSTCLYGKRVHVIAHGEEVDRCYRPRFMVDGKIVESGRNGFPADEERDASPAPQRQDGDKCGPTAKWWGGEL